MRTVTALAAVAWTAGAATAAVPSYVGFSLQARSNIVDGFNLPAGSSFNSATPAINDAGEVAFRLIVVGDTGNAGIWVGSEGFGSVVYEAPVDRLVEDPSLNDLGQAAFEQFDLFSEGIYVWDPVEGASLAVPPGGPFGWNQAGNAQINDDGVIGFRATNSGGNLYLAADGGTQTSYVAEATSPYGFIFTPAFNDAAQFAGKVRVGGTSNDLPDQIRVFESDGSSVQLAVDDDGDPGSPFSGFDNGVDLTDDGRVAFVANLASGGRGVFLASGGGITTIATTSSLVVTAVEFFAPAANASGTVAFRGRDQNGLDAVFVGDGTSLMRLVGEHDLVPTDLGTARIDQHDDSVTFGGAVAINAHGDVAFSCTLTPPDDNQIEWGSGIFIAEADRAVLGDLNGDGVVSFADLLILLGDWGMAGSPADLDGNGTVGFADVLILLGAWTT